MAGNITNMSDFSQSKPRKSKRDTKLPMYMRSRNIGLVDETARNLQNTEYSIGKAWQASLDEGSGEKLFLERRDLIGQWYIHWNEIQRKRFFDFILEQSAYSELKFILAWFKKPIRTQQDFTAVFPRVVSTHIMSYLDPRSLCRASCVSWHWRWLAEQDIIWKRKCLKFAWYLPYQPTELENGAWKKHYIMCIQTIDIDLPLKKSTELTLGKYANVFLGGQQKERESVEKAAFKKWKKTSPLKVHADEHALRPPWVANSYRPKDLEFADKSFYGKISEHHLDTNNKEKDLKLNKHSRSKTTPGETLSNYYYDEKRDESLKRSKSQDFSISFNDHTGPRNMTLSEAIRAETLYQTDGKELDESYRNDDFRQSIKSPRLNTGVYKTCESMRNLQEFSLAYPNIKNPRVIFISSNIPANELLVKATLHGVLPIVYNHDGTTLNGLLEHFYNVLQGRKARSVGFFIGGESGNIALVRGKRLSLSYLGESEMQTFWQALSMEMMSNEEGSHVDIFYPLGGTDTGMELLAQLQVLTGLTFSSPTGTVSSIFKVNDDWLPVPEEESPPTMCFDEVSLLAWSRAGEYIEETMTEVRRSVYHHFENELEALAAKVIGEIIFKAFGLQEVSEIQDISKTLVKALVLLVKEKQDGKSNPTSRFIKCLQECNKEKNTKKKRARKLSENALLQEKGSTEVNNNNLGDSDDSSGLSDDEVSGLSEKVALGERRSVIAHEILSSEREYCHTLSIIQDVYRKPLESSIRSNRPIIGTANLRMVFNDSEALLKLSRDFTNDLSNRLRGWDSHQCLGDVFLKFNTKIKAYMNFLNNYPITLATIEKCEKQHPAFRILLLQLKQQPCSKLMSLQTLLLNPTKRVNEYVNLLGAFLHQTPSEHKDTKNLQKAIEQLKQLKHLFDEASTRLRRERDLKDVQKQIDNCPALVERSRYFIKQEDVTHLRQADQSTNVKPEFRIFQNIGNLGLFLLNDCLVVTTKHFLSFPFQRTMETSYKYQSTLPLSTMKLEEIPDSKYVQNAFIIVTPKRQWVCQAKSRAAVVNWMSLLNGSKRTALN